MIKVNKVKVSWEDQKPERKQYRNKQLAFLEIFFILKFEESNSQNNPKAHFLKSQWSVSNRGISIDFRLWYYVLT